MCCSLELMENEERTRKKFKSTVSSLTLKLKKKLSKKHITERKITNGAAFLLQNLPTEVSSTEFNYNKFSSVQTYRGDFWEFFERNDRKKEKKHEFFF